jgi:hypothetical protein
LPYGAHRGLCLAAWGASYAAGGWWWGWGPTTI